MIVALGDQDLARAGVGNRRVNHQIVAGRAGDGQRWPGEAKARCQGSDLG